jgi:hypothetical protein
MCEFDKGRNLPNGSMNQKHKSGAAYTYRFPGKDKIKKAKRTIPGIGETSLKKEKLKP